MLNALLSLDLAVSALCALFSLHMFRVAAQGKTPAIFPASIFALLATHALLLNVIFHFGRETLAASFLPVIPVLIGPLLFLFFQAVRQRDVRVQFRHLLHAIPAILVLAQMTTGVFIQWVDPIVLGSILAYLLALSLIARNGTNQFRHLGNHALAAFSWLIAGMVYLALSFAADVLILIEISAGASVDQSYGILSALVFKLITVSLLIWLALERTFYFDWLYALGAQTKTRPDDPERGEREKAIVEQFEAELSAPHFFELPPPSLQAMARQMNVSPRHLSEAINNTFGESYSKQMNRRRIECAKRLLLAYPDMSITDVMFSSGFQTKSSFNKEFRAIAHMSPTAFRKNCNG